MDKQKMPCRLKKLIKQLVFKQMLQTAVHHFLTPIAGLLVVFISNVKTSVSLGYI